jgi:hypothetical protein
MTVPRPSASLAGSEHCLSTRADTTQEKLSDSVDATSRNRAPSPPGRGGEAGTGGVDDEHGGVGHAPDGSACSPARARAV